MNDDLVCSLDEKHLSNMRVVDLKQELEKRGLSKSGSKKDLVKRLKQQLQFEKLCEGATSVKDNDSKLDLDEATEQNEFVQRYLAEKQKIYAEHKEAQRLIELRGQQDSASSANEDAADESDVVEVNSSTFEANVVSSSISIEQDISLIDHCDAESGSTTEDDSSTKDDNDVSKSVELDSGENTSGENTDSSVKGKEDLQSIKFQNKECSVSSVKFVCDEGEKTKGEIKIRMKIHPVEPKHSHETGAKICQIVDEELNLPDFSGKTRDNQAQPKANPPQTSEESLQPSSMEYSLSDIQLPDAPGGKKAESKRNNKIVPYSVSKSSANGEENNTAPENFGMEEEISKKHCENVKTNEINVCESGNEIKIKVVNKNDSEMPMVTQPLPSVEKGGSCTSTLEEPCKSLSEENTQVAKVQEKVAESKGAEASTVINPDQAVEVSAKVDGKEPVSESVLDAKDEKPSSLSGNEECDRSQISKSAKMSDSQGKKKLAKMEGLKNTLPVSSIINEPSDDVSSTELGTEVSKHKRKNHRTRHSSSSSSDDSSTPDRVFGPSEKSSSCIAPPSPASRSGSRSESPQSDNKSTMMRIKAPAVNKPPEKRRLKINRNTVIKTEPSEVVVKVEEPMETDAIDKCIGSISHSESLKPTESAEGKGIGCSGESLQPQEPLRVMKFTRRKISIASQRGSVTTEKSPEENPPAKKRRWGNCAAALSRGSLSISSDSLKNLIPDVKSFAEAAVLLDTDDVSPPVPSETLSPQRKEPNLFNIPLIEDTVNEVMPESISNPGVKDLSVETSQVLHTPPHNPVSSILFITNLVRPFTLLQLKDLLKQTGNLIEENFWIDKIKSKCFVMYENEEQAIRTRTTLHGLRWPSSNPKILSVDFATQEELNVHKNGNENPRPAQQTLPAVMEKVETRKFPVLEPPKKKEREERKKDKERHKTTVTHVREWDKDKLTQDSPERLPSQQPEKDGEKSRSAEKKKEKKESKRRQEEDAPAKLLDDLFRKTKASPCIYWLPLTEEQARTREEERQARRLERERRWLQQREQEETERKNRIKSRSGRDKENRRTQSRSRSPVGRRR